MTRLSQFQFETNWHVITGAPCSGKTSVIDQLRHSGCRVGSEVARAYIDDQLRQGASLVSIKANPLEFEREILMQKVAFENTLPHQDDIYLDRSVADSIAYYQFEGLDPREPIRLSQRAHYRTVFLFDQLPFEKDTVRVENHRLASRIEALLERCYSDLGYGVIRVPVMPVEQRTAFVIQHSLAR